MKRIALLFSFGAICSLFLWLAISGRDASPSGIPKKSAASPVLAQTNENLLQTKRASRSPEAPSKNDWPKMSEAQRLQALEKLGEVPVYAEMPRDWYLAEQTSWWGKPLDSAQFWSGRVIWLDDSAVSLARRHGRAYPPIPWKDNEIPAYASREDVLGTGGSVEGPNLQLHWTAEERAFWEKFARTHPKPPDELEMKQYEIAQRLLTLKYDAEQGTPPTSITKESVQKVTDVEINRAIQSAYPAEMLSDQALFWSYVVRNRNEYQKLAAQENGTNSVLAQNLLSRLAVESSRVTQPLTENEFQAANSWKIAYLRRLHKENTDSSYVDAYLKAWNLSTESVFNSTN